MLVNFKKKIIFCFIYFLLSNCSYQNTKTSNLHIIHLENIKKIELKVASYRVENNHNINKKKSTELQGFEKSLQNSFTDWANKKFTLVGEKNNIVMYINQAEILIEEVKKNKGIKKIIFFEEQKRYLVLLKIILSFTDEDLSTADLNINGEIDFFIKDNTSINDRKRLLNKAIKKLIVSVDKNLNENIKKNTFKRYLSRIN